MNIPLIAISLILGGLGVAVGIRKNSEKDLTPPPENEINASEASKKRANIETDENVNNNQDNSNLDSGGFAHVDDLGESEKPE